MNSAALQGENDGQSAHVLSKYQLSDRGAHNSLHRDIWGPREKSMANPWSPENLDGTVILRLAENSLLHQDVAEFVKKEIDIRPLEHLTYSTGPRGSLRLRRALSTFITREFYAREKITAEHLFITPGLASGLDAVAWSICDAGDGILIPQPYYNGFSFDLMNRSDVRAFGVSYKGIKGFEGLDDLFDPKVNRRALEETLRKAQSAGVTIRALLISNPHNPLGRCYPLETLEEFVSFCGRHGLHLLSDEIYAKSVFPNTETSGQTSFISMLSLDLQDRIDPLLVHVLYGASKDFCANGLRLGVVCTRNEALLGSLSSISMFSWSPHVLQDVWAAMLTNTDWIQSFMERKQRLMLENYGIATSTFRQHNISYYEMNAGLFIWIDLRRLFLPTPTSTQESSDTDTDTATASSTPPHTDDYNSKRELEIINSCASQGVMIAPGSVYAPEEFGWFRITFSLERAALEEGLRRFIKAISQIDHK